MYPDSMANELADLLASFVHKFPDARHAILERLSHYEKSRVNDAQSLGESFVPEFIIWTAAAGGPVQTLEVSRSEAETFSARKNGYDIFIGGLVVLIAGKPAFLEPRLFWLLVEMLRYRNRDLPPLESFQRAWGHSSLLPFYDEQTVLQNHLRFAVSGLRRTLKPLIDRGRLRIPHKQREHGYRCEGRFTFCVILDRALEPRATLHI